MPVILNGRLGVVEFRLSNVEQIVNFQLSIVESGFSLTLPQIAYCTGCSILAALPTITVHTWHCTVLYSTQFDDFRQFSVIRRSVQYFETLYTSLHVLYSSTVDELIRQFLSIKDRPDDFSTTLLTFDPNHPKIFKMGPTPAVVPLGRPASLRRQTFARLRADA